MSRGEFAESDSSAFPSLQISILLESKVSSLNLFTHLCLPSTMIPWPNCCDWRNEFFKKSFSKQSTKFASFNLLSSSFQVQIHNSLEQAPWVLTKFLKSYEKFNLKWASVVWIFRSVFTRTRPAAIFLWRENDWMVFSASTWTGFWLEMIRGILFSVFSASFRLVETKWRSTNRF